jgi:Protein of unknown function (DUF993)
MARALVRLDTGSDLELDDGLLAPARSHLARLGAAEPVRLAFAAAHVVMRDSYRTAGHSAAHPGTPEEVAGHVDWTTTRALRARLARLDLGIGEALDAGQRLETGWPVASRLIELTSRLAPRAGFLAGACADHLREVRTKAELVDAVVFQGRYIERHGGWPIVLPLAWLAERGAREGEVLEVYRAIFQQLNGPVFVHWPGDEAPPLLRGCFPGRSFTRVMASEPDKVRGARLPRLDPPAELELRRQLLARDQIAMVGDDAPFAQRLRGADPAASAEVGLPERWTTIGGRRVALGAFDHALLATLTAAAEPVALGLAYLARGDGRRAGSLLGPCEALAHKLVEPSAAHSCAGLAFAAWLNGLQPSRLLPNRADRARSKEHLLELARLASQAGALADAAQSALRLRAFLLGTA